jgi:glycosyltransferase involved in cell wall biosynthesis
MQYGKIAIVIDNITAMAGTERAVCNLVNLLIEYGVNDPIIISVYSNSGKQKYPILKDVKIYHLGIHFSNNLLWQMLSFFSFLNKLRKADKLEHFDILIGTRNAMNVFSTFVRKGIKVIGCEHFNFDSGPLRSKIFKKLFYSRLNAIVVLTVSDSKHYSFHKKVVVIPNSISFTTKKHADLHTKRILAIGRLTKQKGFDMLIEAVSMIKKICQEQEWEVKIIGSGNDEDMLKNKINDLNINNIVKICPPTDDVISEYQNASIYAMSSRYEGFPMVLIEAQSVGLPIVSFNCPEGPEEIVINTRNGLLIENENIRQMADALTELITNPGKRFLLGKNALEDSKRYSPEKIFALWNNLIHSLEQ